MGPDLMKTPAMKLFAAMSVFSMVVPVDAKPQAPRTSSAQRRGGGLRIAGASNG